MEFLLLLAIGFLIRGAMEHSKGDRGRSRDQRVKEVAKSFPKGALPKSKQRSAARHAAAGWWAREVRHGFPVHRTGWHAAWLAHQTVADHHKARREEARTTALETRASVLKGMPEHKQRQAEAQAELDKIEDELAAQQAKGSPATGKRAVQSAADEVAARRKQREQEGVRAPVVACPVCQAPPGYAHLPACTSQLGDVRDANGKLVESALGPDDPRLTAAPEVIDTPVRVTTATCDACGHPSTQTDELVPRDGFQVHQSHTHDPGSGFYEGPAPERSDDLPGGPMYDRAPDGTHKQDATTTASPTTQGAPVADTNYDVVMENAKKRADEAEQDAVAAAQRHQAAMQHAEDMQAVGVQGNTLSAQMELVDQLKHAEDAAKATGEQAAAVRDALAKEHGGIKSAVDDAPIPRPAETDFYVGS
jgi:hypothetical protein